MKFAICNETFWNGDFAETCAAAARHGYTGLEIAPYTLDDVQSMSESDARRVGEIIRSYRLEPVGFHWLLAKTSGLHLTDPDPLVRHRTFDHACHLISLCGAMGGRILVWGSPGQRTIEPGWNRAEAEERVMAFFQKLSPHLAEAGVTIAFEFLCPRETNFINTAAEAIDLLKRIGSPYVRLNLDVKAMSADPRAMADIVRESLPWTAHFHANDPNLLGPGMGDVDFAPIARELVGGGYEGWVSVEVFDLAPGADHIASESLRHLKAAFS